MRDIKILGGGLSGLSAAINLAKAGYNVDVFEKRSDCGKRFHGDLEGIENWSSKIDVMDELNSMNIKPNFRYTPFKTVGISDGNEVVKMTLKKPMFYLIKRGVAEDTIDQGFKNQALDLGVNIHFNSKESKENMDIISIGPSENKYIGIVKGIRFETESDDIAIALLNKKASIGGYSYLVISNGYGCMCSVNVFYIGNTEVDNFFKKTYEIFTSLADFEIKNKKNVGGVGCFLLNPRYVENGKIYTGEAAGFQDMLWGFGMRYAIISGYLAASSIIEGKNYKRLIKKNLGGRLKTSVVNRFLTEKGGYYVYAYIFNQGKKNLDKWMDLLYQRFNPSLYSRVLYPFAKQSLSKKTMRLHKNLIK
jgi:flavin-dependent dehydrogenase